MSPHEQEAAEAAIERSFRARQAVCPHTQLVTESSIRATPVSDCPATVLVFVAAVRCAACRLYFRWFLPGQATGPFPDTLQVEIAPPPHQEPSHEPP